VSTLVGFAGVLLAIVFALLGPRQVRKERRIIHELDVLRDLADRASELAGAAHRKARLRGPLLTLQDQDACPVLGAFAHVEPTTDGQNKYDTLLQNAYPDASPGGLPTDVVWVTIEAACREEVETAIRARLSETGLTEPTSRGLGRT
jgi:hypothetical protein